MEIYRRKSLNSVFLFRLRTAAFMMALCVFMLAAGIANAVTYTDSSPQTTPGQNFIFTFSPVSPWSVGDGTFTVHARGDYSINYPTYEFLNWDIDGLISDVGTPASGTVINEFTSDDVEWEQSFTISDSLLNSITSDSSITISIDLSSEVGFGIDPSKHFVEVELTYNASGSQCLVPPAPDNPDPCDGAIDVLVDTCLSWSGGSGGGPGTCVVVPNANMSVEGNSNNGYPFNLTSSMRYQQIYDATEVGQSGVITEIRLRPDVDHGDAFSSATMDVEIFLGYAATSVLAPSGTFANNIGAGYVKVYDGILTLSSSDMGGPPRNFDVIINVDDIFAYDPANGPLLLDIKLYNSPGSTQFDGAGYGVQTATTRIRSNSVNSTTGTIHLGGQGDPYGLVTMLCFDGATPAMPSSTAASAAVVRDPNTYEVDLETGIVSSAAVASQNVEPGLDEHDNSAMTSGGAQAPQVERMLSTSCFTFGGAGESWSGASRLRANIITVAAQQTLSEINMELNFSDSRDLYFYVLESSSVTGPYTPVLEKVVPTVGTGRTFYSSGPTNFVLNPGNYYGIGVAWGAGSSVTYYRNRVNLPVPWDLGMVEGYLFSDAGPPYTGPISETRSFAIYSSELCFGGSEPPPSSCPSTWDVYLGTDPCGMWLADSNLADPNYCPASVLANGTTYFWQVIAKNSSGETPGNIWSFETEGSPPDCSNAVPSVAEIWMPRHDWVDIEILDVNDPDGDTVTITITGITQDEPVDGPGSGKTSPDGMGVGTSVAHIRAERSGQSRNGRVYEISFEADDGTGLTCNGSVKVCVPHDQRKGHECVDDGQLYDSTVTEIFQGRPQR